MDARFGSRLLVALAVIPSSAPAGIVGSAHDFSRYAWAQGQTCAICHTPHGGSASPTGSRWNHQLSTTTYTLYSSPTLDATPRQPEHYGSKLCLSCHDGTVAMDAFNGRQGGQFMHGEKRIGTDLSKGHPVGITYDSALAAVDPGLENPDARHTGLGGTITEDMLFGTGNLECASCHNVHNRQSEGNRWLLRVTIRGSRLCRTCHKY